MIKAPLILVTFFMCIGSAYTQNDIELEINIENISQTWEVYDVINENQSAEELKETIDMLEGVSLKFNNDMTFSFSFILDLDGTWKLEDRVIYTEDRKSNNIWTIHSLKSNVMILSRNNAPNKLVFKSI